MRKPILTVSISCRAYLYDSPVVAAQYAVFPTSALLKKDVS